MDPIMLNGQPTRTPSEDQMLLASVLRRYEDKLERTHERVVQRLKSNTIDVTDLRDLTYRHTLPLFAALDALSCEPRCAEQVACGAVLAYSIPLVALDTKLDGRASSLRQSESIWDEIERPGVAKLLTYSGYNDIAEGSGSAIAVRLISRIASDTIAAMNLDATRRGLSSQLEVDSRFMDDYWNSPGSRLRGSGIGRLMIGLASILADGEVTAGRDQISTTLGILRQLADELMDVVEDVLHGLVTLPVAYALRCPRVSAELTKMIQRIWREGAGSRSQGLQSPEECHLRELILMGAGHRQIMQAADQLLDNACHLSLNTFATPERVDVLLIHRRKQIDSAVANRLREPSPPLSVGDLLAIA